MAEEKITSRSRRHQHMLRTQGEFQRQLQDDWDEEEGYQKDERIRLLEAENRQVKEQLARSNSLARLALLERDGLSSVIRHLRKSWDKDEGKEKINGLISDRLQESKKDPSKQEMVDGWIDDLVYKKRPATKPSR